MSDQGSYEVGFKKPPKHTQFKKGDRANPFGRPKGTKNLKTDLIEELQETVTVQTGGKPITISKQRALLKKLMAQALMGDARAAAQVITLSLKLLADLPPDAAPTLGPSDTAILERYLARQLKKQAVRPATAQRPGNSHEPER